MKITKTVNGVCSGLRISTIGYLHGNNVVYPLDKLNPTSTHIDSDMQHEAVSNAKEFNEGDSFIVYLSYSKQTDRYTLIGIVPHKSIIDKE